MIFMEKTKNVKIKKVDKSAFVSCFPYASGGVAIASLKKLAAAVFSLRKWGCCR